MTLAETHVQTACAFHDLTMGFAVGTRLLTNQKHLQTFMHIDIYARMAYQKHNGAIHVLLLIKKKNGGSKGVLTRSVDSEL